MTPAGFCSVRRSTFPEIFSSISSHKVFNPHTDAGHARPIRIFWALTAILWRPNVPRHFAMSPRPTRCSKPSLNSGIQESGNHPSRPLIHNGPKNVPNVPSHLANVPHDRTRRQEIVIFTSPDKKCFSGFTSCTGGSSHTRHWSRDWSGNGDSAPCLEP